LTKNLQTDKEKAITLFYWVRDDILYRVGFWNRKASETLAEGKGVCTSKANLLIALLRSIEIPAGYGVMRVKGREYFGPIVPKRLQSKINQESTHVYACVYLGGQWLRCDPSDDREFSEKTCQFNPQSLLINWDGSVDALLNLEKSHILKDEWPLANIDDIISKKPRNAKGIPLKIANLYIEFLRQNSDKTNNKDELEPLFKKWLMKNYFPYYLFYLSAMWFIPNRKKKNNKK